MCLSVSVSLSVCLSVSQSVSLSAWLTRCRAASQSVIQPVSICRSTHLVRPFSSQGAWCQNTRRDTRARTETGQRPGASVSPRMWQPRLVVPGGLAMVLFSFQVFSLLRILCYLRPCTGGACGVRAVVLGLRAAICSPTKVCVATIVAAFQPCKPASLLVLALTRLLCSIHG